MENLTYDEFINNILEVRGRFACGDEYHERHHIVPKCMGGGNEDENLIDLFAREHFIAHKMLAEENPDNNSLAYAWGCMAFPSNQYEQRSQVSPEEYEECRKMLAKRSPSDETRHNMSVAQRKRLQTPEDNPFFGKHHTEETKTIIRNKAKERFKHPEDNPFYGKHHSEETKEKIRKTVEGTRSGAKNPRSKPVYSPELDEEFWGAKEAEIKYGIHHQHIAKCCRGTRRSAGKHPITGEKLTWKYITTDLEEC